MHLSTLSFCGVEVSEEEVCLRLSELSSEEKSRILRVSLSGCSRLQRLPTELFELRQLRELALDRCLSLAEIPTEMSTLTKLSTLLLTGCRALPPQFQVHLKARF